MDFFLDFLLNCWYSPKKGKELSRKMDFEKSLNTILYILKEIGSEVSKTKILKLLFFADFEHVRKFGRPITWDKYCKLPRGPVPSYLLTVIDKILGKSSAKIPTKQINKFKKAIRIKEAPYLGVKAAFLSPYLEPNMNDISPSEIETINAVLKKYGSKSADTLGREAKKHPAWKRSKDREMEYSSAFPKGKKKEFFSIWQEELDGIERMLQ
jgi:uncharacterized phage-associated protein